MSTNTETPPAQNTINWFDIPVTDAAKALRLYEAMLDTKLAVSDFGGVPHVVIGSAGSLVADPKRPPKRGSGTVIYFDAPGGVSRALARAVEAGAKVIQPLTPIDPHGTIALVEDLDGNVIGLHANPTK